MNNLINNTLSAWLLVEALSPGVVDYSYRDKLDSKYFKSQKQQVKLKTFENFFEIWNHHNYIISDEKKNKGSLQFKFYRYNFRLNEINKKLKSIFNNKSEIYNPNMSQCYSYTFTVNERGILDIESLHVPLIMCGLNKFENNLKSNIEDHYNDSFEKFKHKVIEISGEDSLDERKLNKIDQAYKSYFSVMPNIKSGLSDHYVGVDFIKHNQQTDINFNSFFTGEIELARKNPNKAIMDYIAGVNDKDRIVVDENKKVIEELLHPSRLPDGRWPSKSEFRLSLMQQLSVNQIVNNDETITSVNGPPGTGKTTLLKDVFAHLVVERGKELVKLDEPKDAFERVKLDKTDKNYTYILKENISKFKMVVTSSNNGAVENISKELPQLTEIIRDSSDSAFPKHEEGYAKLAKELEDFSCYASELINEESWGLFSGVFGKQQNINKVLDVLIKNDKGNTDFSKLLKNKNEEMGNNLKKEWQIQTNLFNEDLKKVEELKRKSIKAYEVYKNYERSIINKEKFINKEKKLKEKEQELIQSIIDTKNKKEKIQEKLIEFEEDLKLQNELIKLEENHNKRLINIIKSFFKQRENDELKILNNTKKQIILDIQSTKYKLKDITKKLSKNNKVKEKLKKELVSYQEKLEEIEKIEKEFEELCNDNSIEVPTKSFWSEENYEKRQVTNLWMSDDLQYYRAILFLRSMLLHRLLLIANNVSIYYSLQHFKERRSKPKKLVLNAWNVIHLIFPVISTTFASFGRMYDRVPKDFIDYLFIDEAGQAVPQAAVGAIFRSKKVIAVGDPSQIEPVVILDDSLMDNIRKSYNIPERLLSKESSVQSVSDYANRYGFWKKLAKDEQIYWNGIPLWVHRRCLNPMFTIANQIAYANKMVLPKDQKEKYGKTIWYNVSGKATTKQYVPNQGDKLIEFLKKDWIEALNNGEDEPNVFVISPFKAVKNEISKLVKNKLSNIPEIDSNRLSKWINKSIGTVHTFQGKEASKVYFIIGTDDKQDGALNWSCEKPNLINVAVTRAKREFYIIGDTTRIKNKPFYETIYKEQNN